MKDDQRQAVRRSWRVGIQLLLVSAVTAAGLALPTPAVADEVTVAQTRVDQLQDLAKDTTEKLLEGTKRWEADQVALVGVRLQLRNTQRQVQESGERAFEGRARVSELARRLYMSPAGDGMQLAVSSGQSDLLGALQFRGALATVAGNDSDLVRQATADRVRLRGQEARALALTADAERLVERSARLLAELKALALSTAEKLDAAQDALQKARAEKAERLARIAAQKAAEEAARAARAAKAANDAAAARRAAEQAREARTRASRSRPVSGGGPACSGRSTSGQQNGNLDPASLCPLWMAGRHRLRADAASGFNAMSKVYAAQYGQPLCVTDSYRSYSEQVDVYRRKPGLAAVPGTSNHGWGIAVDFCGGIQNSGSAAYRWMEANAGRFGWFHPDWAKPSGSKPEAWHWEYNG